MRILPLFRSNSSLMWGVQTCVRNFSFMAFASTSSTASCGHVVPYVLPSVLLPLPMFLQLRHQNLKMQTADTVSTSSRAAASTFLVLFLFPESFRSRATSTSPTSRRWLCDFLFLSGVRRRASSRRPISKSSRNWGLLPAPYIGLGSIL